MTDPISDMLTRIRNASMVKKSEVVVPMSKLKFEIAQILKRKGLVNDVQVLNQDTKKAATFGEMKISLKYKKDGASAISSIKRISKPGLRVYAKKDNLPKVLNNLGFAIMSTPRGLMTNKEARKDGLGGEVICEIY